MLSLLIKTELIEANEGLNYPQFTGAYLVVELPTAYAPRWTPIPQPVLTRCVCGNLRVTSRTG